MGNSFFFGEKDQLKLIITSHRSGKRNDSFIISIKVPFLFFLTIIYSMKSVQLNGGTHNNVSKVQTKNCNCCRCAPLTMRKWCKITLRNKSLISAKTRATWVVYNENIHTRIHSWIIPDVNGPQNSVANFIRQNKKCLKAPSLWEQPGRP